MNLNLKLNIKSIILYEKLAKKPFNKFDFKNEEECVILLYAMIAANNEDFRMTFKEACMNIFSNEEYCKYLSDKLKTEFEYFTQFETTEKKEEEKEPEEEENKDGKEEKEVYIYNVIPILLECGLDINYILYEMPYTDIGYYTDYKVEKERNNIELQRFWVFYMIMPHIDHKKIKTPVDLIEFEWEKEERIKKANEDIKNNKEKLKKFMANAAPIPIKEIKNRK